MRILITNNTLANRAGSELYVRDLASGLLERGHEPIAYSARLGDVARDIRAAGVPVTDDLDTIVDPPEIIHGHHHLDTMVALLRFPATPAIYVCHGSTPWEEEAPRFPRILRYVGVDHACRDRLLLRDAIPPNRIRVILNFVDLARFQPRTQLPSRPRRALIFSNQANEHTHVPVIRSACEHEGIQLDVVGLGVGKSCARPETVLGNYDIVFAKGRAALEALAVGSAVVLCDAIGAGPMVSTTNVEQLRPLNFGLRALVEPLRSEVIMREIARYDPIDATTVSGLIRTTAGRDRVIDELLVLYEEVINEHSRIPGYDRAAEERAVGVYLRDLAPRLYQRDQAMEELNLTQAELNLTETELNLTKTELEAARAQLEMIANSRSWRLISRYSGIKQRLVEPARRVLRSISDGRRKVSPPEAELLAEQAFDRIYHQREWGDGESVSGPGSTTSRAAAFTGEVVALLNEIKAESLLDAGCGDFNWMKELELGLSGYIGIDVVSELISKNQQAHSNEIRSFLRLDMTRNKLPRVDVILCRDGLVHLSHTDILATIENFRQSGSTYLLTTTFTGVPGNVDIRTGEWRQINLQMPPFNFPEPLKLIDEKCMHSAGVFADKCLGLWALKDVPRSR